MSNFYVWGAEERFRQGHLTDEEKALLAPANTIKNEWVWECPFCKTRNSYRRGYCQRKACAARRFLVDGGYKATRLISTDVGYTWGGDKIKLVKIEK